MEDTPHEPWIADIALELEKIRRLLEGINNSLDEMVHRWNEAPDD